MDTELLELYSEDLFRKISVSRLHSLGDSKAGKQSRTGDNRIFWREGEPNADWCRMHQKLFYVKLF